MPLKEWTLVDMTMYLIKLLSEKGYPMTGGMSLIPIIQHIKETLCFVSNDFEREMNMSKSIEKTYELPDGMLITLDKESIQTSQPLFDPNFIPRDNDMDGLHSEIYHSILKCDLDLRKELFSTISLSGGNCQWHGIEKRLERELQLLVPPSLIQCVKLVDERSRPPFNKQCTEKRYLAWKGAALMAESQHFDSMSISKSLYEEYGSHIVHRKWF